MERIEVGLATLYHGDAREVLASMSDNSVDFIFTDPPYGHNNNDDGDLITSREKALGNRTSAYDLPKHGRPIANDGLSAANALARLLFSEADRLLAAGGCCCCCGGGGGPDPQFARWSLWLDELLGFKQMVVWDKGPIGMGWHYRRSYETVLVGQKRGGPCRWYDTTSRVENIIRPGGAVRKIIPSSSHHPTAKDPNLAAHFIRLHTQVGHLVLDPFMGGGSTLVAAVSTGRRFIGVELDARWFGDSVKLAEEMERRRKFLRPD